MAGEIAGGVAVTIFIEDSSNPRCFVKTERGAPPQPSGQGCHFTPVIPRNSLQRSAPPSDIKSLTSNFYGLTPLVLETISILIVAPRTRATPLRALFDSRLPREVANLKAEVIARFLWNYITLADFHYITLKQQRIIEIFDEGNFMRRAKTYKTFCIWRSVTFVSR